MSKTKTDKPLVTASISIAFNVEGMSKNDRAHYETMIIEALESKGIQLGGQKKPRIVNQDYTYQVARNAYMRMDVTLPDEGTEIRAKVEHGKALRDARTKFVGSLRALALKTGIGAAALMRFEDGKGVPTPEEWAKLRAALPSLPEKVNWWFRGEVLGHIRVAYCDPDEQGNDQNEYALDGEFPASIDYIPEKNRNGVPFRVGKWTVKYEGEVLVNDRLLPVIMQGSTYD